MITYKTIWDDYCSWFLEMVKPDYQQPIDQITYQSVVKILESLLKIVHPFTPFIAEEIWQQLKNRNNTYIVNASWPTNLKLDSLCLLNSIIFKSGYVCRNLRKENNISNKVLLSYILKLITIGLAILILY